jgi:hypothetical protein
MEATPMADKPDDLAALLAKLTGEAIAGQGRVNDLLHKTPALTTGLNTGDLALHTKSNHVTLNHAGIAAAAKQIQHLPEDGWAVHCIMGGNFHGFDVIPTIQHLAGCAIDTLTIATLSFSKRNLSNLALMLDQGTVRTVGLLTSNYFAKADALIYGAAKRELVEKRTGHRLAFTRTHAKVICIKTDDGRYFVVESSANLRSCVNFEQFALFQSRELFDWHSDWIDYLLTTGGK